MYRWRERCADGTLHPRKLVVGATQELPLVLLDVPTGMRASELPALQWQDIDFEEKVLNIRQAIWHQHVGPVKTKASQKVMPLGEEVIADLHAWRLETPYAADDDWVFASLRLKGRQPYWPENLMKNHLRPAAREAGITKHIS